MAYDSRGGTPIAGERVRAIARMVKSGERQYKRRAAGRPDFAYNVATNARMRADSQGREQWFRRMMRALRGVWLK